MSDNFLTSQVIINLPDWFVPIFQQNDRICLPYVISFRDVDDIINAMSLDTLIFHIDTQDVPPIKRDIGSVIEFVNDIHDLIFQNVPAEAVISFGGNEAWMYYDGDERFCCMVGQSHIIKKAFRNSRNTMKLYYIDQTSDIALDDEMKSQLFESITTIS